MQISYSFFLSSASLRQRKLRSFLTIGGMGIGVALITFLVSLGFGLQRLIQSEITNAEQLTVLDVTTGDSSLLSINKESVNQFQKLDSVQTVSPSISLSGQLVRDDQVTDVAVYGVKPDSIAIENIQVELGETFSGSDVPETIATSTALNLVGLPDSKESLGQEVTLKLMTPKKQADGTTSNDLVPTDLTVKVIGIVKDNELTVAYLPLELLQSLGFPATYTDAKIQVGNQNPNERYSIAKVKVVDKSKLSDVRLEIEKLGYQVTSVADTVGQVNQIFVIFQLVVGGFGAIAMFVAALGALNTLTVSLLERTREIGLMKAFGATSSDIYRLFLSEAMTMGILGSILGVGVGVGAGMGVNYGVRSLAVKYGGQAVDIFYTPWQFFLIITGVVVIISVVTGFYPARRAATIQVLEALRNE